MIRHRVGGLALATREFTTIHSETTMAIDAFMGNFVGDLGAVMHAATIVVGDQLGLYKKRAAELEPLRQSAQRRI